MAQFREGDRVKMKSALTSATTGRPIGWVYGVVRKGPSFDYVEWRETGLVTQLPNPNVQADR